MQKRTAGPNDAGQRLDKYLRKLLAAAPSSFLYKMLRKKNITLNGKKAQGSEKLAVGDEICLWLSDETIAAMEGAQKGDLPVDAELSPPEIIFESADILVMNKPAGELSQKAAREDISINERMLAYLLSGGQISRQELNRFRPSVCNRLDRNTSGLITAGKSLAGLQFLSEAFRDRLIHKYYHCLVWGELKEEKRISGYLTRDEASNKVTISRQARHHADYIETAYRPLSRLLFEGRAGRREAVTFLEVLLVTGRTHQIRAHLAGTGHPILGDPKYGDPGKNALLRRQTGIRRQLLHAARLEMPDQIDEEKYPGLKGLEGRIFVAPDPADFHHVLPAGR